MAPTQAEREALAELRSARTIRERCHRILSAGLDGRLRHFAVHLDRMPEVVERVVRVTREQYPDLQIPYHSRWNHFRAGGIDRVAWVEQSLGALDPDERTRAHFDLVVTSVLLDAGAGERWTYDEERSRASFSRSEGLAVASLHMFLDGLFSSDPASPWRADADGLESLSDDALARGFQIREGNPLVGLRGRADLMRSLGRALRTHPKLFGSDAPRVGHLADALREGSRQGALPATAILDAVLEGLGPIWPGRHQLGGVNLGDVWPHPEAGGDGLSAGLVPFHKLSQWLTYSLVEPLEAADLRVTEVPALTGLAEYRNGGLFVDSGVLEPKRAAVREQSHRPGDEVVVEWRALTVALLDRTAESVRDELGLDAEALPLAKVLEGGTWTAGRRIARELRSDARPPIHIESDGTVF